MRFLAPGWLALLAAVAALAAAYLLVQRRRARYAVRFAALPLLERVMPRGPGWRRHLPAVAFLLTVAGLVLAMARPAMDVQVPRERATVVVAVDVSMSMGAQDVPPSRIDAAVGAAREFVAQLPPAFPVGLVLFSGTSAVAVPPTPDRAAVLAAFDRVTLGPGTAIGDAVLAALDAVRTADAALGPASEPVPARIVLLSDGANTTGTPLPDAAAAAAAAAVPVSTIAYGTPTGTATIDGTTVRVPADVDALAALAADSGGLAYRAETATELTAVYADIGSAIGYRTEEREVTTAVLAAALLAAFAAAAGSLTWFSRLP